MTDVERMRIALDYITNIHRDEQLLADYNEMITNLLVLIMTMGNTNAMKVAAEALFLLGYNAGVTRT